ncbi:MAG TPA: DUF4365 domain-containing protein [Thermodesulfobacteriota bacterium]|nr:DUF4365 domain-containing protein [Thermodesulfobacteriota bacterium]
MGKKVHKNLMKGNYGEHLVAHILSEFCFVRPVVGHTDIGVDLYCESIIDGIPFLHFWVQVKSSEDIPNEERQVKFRFDTSSLEYWEKQPVPVLSLLVPIKWPPEKIAFIHVVDISFSILEKGINKGKTQVLKSLPNYALPISDSKQLSSKLNKLLVEHMPITISAMYAREGFIYAAPKPKEEHTKYYAGHFLSRYIHKIGERTRQAVTFGELKKDEHYEVHEALGLLNEAEGKLTKAKSCYQRAIKSIMGDPKINYNQPPWSEVVERLQERKRKLNNPMRKSTF